MVVPLCLSYVTVSVRQVESVIMQPLKGERMLRDIKESGYMAQLTRVVDVEVPKKYTVKESKKRAAKAKETIS
jgi:hypothetical protein